MSPQKGYVFASVFHPCVYLLMTYPPSLPRCTSSTLHHSRRHNKKMASNDGISVNSAPNDGASPPPLPPHAGVGVEGPDNQQRGEGVGLGWVGLCRVGPGWVKVLTPARWCWGGGTRQVGLGQVGLGRVRSGWVGSGPAGSGRVKVLAPARWC